MYVRTYEHVCRYTLSIYVFKPYMLYTLCLHVSILRVPAPFWDSVPVSLCSHDSILSVYMYISIFFFFLLSFAGFRSIEGNRSVEEGGRICICIVLYVYV